MFLTPEELIDLTRKVRPGAQCRALRKMGIDFIVRPDGTPVVLRSAIEATRTTKRKAPEPNWDATAKAL